MKVDCWEFKKCGREPGGAKADEQGVCPAATESEKDGVNNSKNAGRICWSTTGTLCRGEVQGTFAKKIADCANCDFYKLVSKEEGKEFKIY